MVMAGMGVNDQRGEVMGCLGSLNGYEDCLSIVEPKWGRNYGK